MSAAHRFAPTRIPCGIWGRRAAKRLVATCATVAQFQTHTKDYAFLIFNNFAGTGFHIQHFEVHSGADHLSIFLTGPERSMAWSAPKIAATNRLLARGSACSGASATPAQTVVAGPDYKNLRRFIRLDPCAADLHRDHRGFWIARDSGRVALYDDGVKPNSRAARRSCRSYL